MASGSLMSEASTLLTSGTQAPNCHLAQSLLHDVGSRLHQRAMKGRAHRKQHGAARAVFRRERYARSIAAACR
jgi:hypothetical protein